ncbi:MAG: hypothetical protein DRN99_05210 [Thermoproteota archaeon]|nr:MAG: hypothetical protein DRN99_05210 [Candidatus Korarchaeota archaeon]
MRKSALLLSLALSLLLLGATEAYAQPPMLEGAVICAGIDPLTWRPVDEKNFFSEPRDKAVYCVAVIRSVYSRGVYVYFDWNDGTHVWYAELAHSAKKLADRPYYWYAYSYVPLSELKKGRNKVVVWVTYQDQVVDRKILLFDVDRAVRGEMGVKNPPTRVPLGEEYTLVVQVFNRDRYERGVYTVKIYPETPGTMTFVPSQDTASLMSMQGPQDLKFKMRGEKPGLYYYKVELYESGRLLQTIRLSVEFYGQPPTPATATTAPATPSLSPTPKPTPSPTPAAKPNVQVVLKKYEPEAGPIEPGQEIVLTYTLANLGAADAPQVTVDAEIPEGLLLKWKSPAQDLKAGQQATWTVKLTAEAPGEYTVKVRFLSPAKGILAEEHLQITVSKPGFKLPTAMLAAAAAGLAVVIIIILIAIRRR